MKEWKDIYKSDTVETSLFRRSRGGRRGGIAAGTGGRRGRSEAQLSVGGHYTVHDHNGVVEQDDEEGAAYVQHAAPHTLPDVDSDTLSSDPADSSDDDGEGAGGAEPRGQETKYPLPYDSSAVVEDFFRSVTAADKVCSELRTATQKVLQCSADFEAASTACPVCGKPGDPKGMPPFKVTVVTWDQPLSLFKKKGLTHKYGLDYRQLSRRRYTLGNAYVRGFEPPKGSADVGRNADCSSFTADKVLAKEEAGKLVTAAGVVLCRHGMLLRLVNLFHGERHMYATAAAASILAAGTAVQFWWYDIACRWSKSWQKWHQALDPSTAWLGVAAAMVSLVPPFHSYAHSYECQKTFGHQGQTGAGRGTGEIVEIFNSQVGKQGKVLRYTSPAHRESVLEDVGRRYCRQVELGLPARVYRMRLRAQAAHDAAQDRIETLEATLTPQQVEMACAGHAAQRSQQRHDQPKRHANADAVAGEPGWKAVYARCRLALMKLQRLDTVDNPADPVPLSVLVAGGDNLTLRQRPALIKQLEEEKKKLEQEHAAAAPPPREWEADSAAFKEAVSDLAESEIKKITSEIEGLVLDYNSLKVITEKLAGRKKEQRYAIKEKQRVKGQLRQQWGRLAAWCRVDAAGQQGREEKARNKKILEGGLAAVLRGTFPWASDSGAGSSGGRAVASLVRSYNQRARAKEELRLIEAEVERGCAYYERRVRILKAAQETSAPGLGLLLKPHLSRCELMLKSFQGLQRGDVPDDTSLSVDTE
eukprot:XP_001692766.1 Tcr1 transposon ORF2 [Chlamydomonas reinhardtii]